MRVRGLPSRSDGARGALRVRATPRTALATLIVAGVAALALTHGSARAAALTGVWLIDGRVAVQMFDCSDLLCGRILWLLKPRDPQDRLDRDKNNPDRVLRQRKLCGLTIIWNLRATGRNRWGGGWFYNPDDGETYSVSAQLSPADALIARIYAGAPLFGKTKILTRIQRGVSTGWC